MNPQIRLLVVFLSAFTFLVGGSVFGKPIAKPKKKAAASVAFTSPCATQGQHGVDRWTPKTDASPVPRNGSAIRKVTPSDIYAWKGPGPKVPLTRKTETRLAVEQNWYELTGRVADVRVEADGDIHVALADATGKKPRRVGVEVPVGPRWCKIRQAVFSWTNAKFPFSIKSNKVFRIVHPHIIAVTGKAFYDVDHAPKDHSNRSTIHENTAAFEIHPVAALRVLR
jgi:hypothetical protein